MNVCFVSQEYPDETGWGGIGTYTAEMAHGLARRGHQVIVVSRAIAVERTYVESDGVQVHRILPRMRLDHMRLLWRFNRIWEGYRLAVAIALQNIVHKHQVHLIETPELGAESLLYKMLPTKRLPIVVRLHSGAGIVNQFEKAASAAECLDSRWEKQVVRAAAHVTAPSKALLDSSRKIFPFLDGKTTVVPNPIDSQLFAPNSHIHPVPNQVLCIARPRPLKGLKVLAQAIPLVWAILPETRFSFVGAAMGRTNESVDVAFRAELGDLVAHPQVEIVSPLPRTKMPTFYHAASICVVPSLWEGFGYVCAEAMACGKPVIASRVGGLAEMIEDDKSGVLVTPGNPVELAQAIIELLQNPSRCKALGAAARHSIEEVYSTPVIVKRMEDLYQKVIARNG